jgi:hypothetical protein
LQKWKNKCKQNKTKPYARAKAYTIKSKCKKKEEKQGKMGLKGRAIDLLCKIEVV